MKLNRDTPLKWKKYLVMSNLGLRTIENLESEIKRYSIKDINSLIKDISEDINQTSYNEKNMYIIVLISMYELFKLPNIQIFNKEDLEKLSNDLKIKNYNKYREVWFTKTRINQGTKSVGGRIYIYNNGLEIGQIIEQVWNSSPRKIDEYNKKSDVTYLRAKRDNWKFKPIIDEIIISKKDCINKKTVMQQLAKTIISIDNRMNDIEIFSNYLRQIGITGGFSLDYIMIRNELIFIDFDTSDNIKVINSQHKMVNLE